MPCNLGRRQRPTVVDTAVTAWLTTTPEYILPAMCTRPSTVCRVILLLLLCSAAAADSPPARIFGLLMEGCSGSTFVTHTARALLDCHLPHTSSAKTDAEILKREKAMKAMLRPALNGVHSDKGAALKEGDPNWWANVLHQLDTWAFSRNKTVVVKADLECGSEAISSWAPTLHRLGVPFVLGWRTNVLDRALCVIRDCLQGRSILSLGRRIDNATVDRDCMARRQTTGPPIGVRIDVSALRRSLSCDPVNGYPVLHQPSPSSSLAVLLEHGLGAASPVDTPTPAWAGRLVPAPLVLYEDLAAFQYFRANETSLLAKSIHAWSSLLTGWGVAHTTESVYHCLRNNFDTRPWPQPHLREVENAGAVIELLRHLGPKYEAMWRKSRS